MKYKYRFDEITFKSGNKSRIIIMEEEKYYLVAVFLMSDIQGPGSIEYVCEAFDNVLSGKCNEEKISGNVCALEINKDTTIIYDKLADDGMGDWCQVDTKQLKQLVEIWIAEREHFKAKQQ